MNEIYRTALRAPTKESKDWERREAQVADHVEQSQRKFIRVANGLKKDFKALSKTAEGRSLSIAFNNAMRSNSGVQNFLNEFAGKEGADPRIDTARDALLVLIRKFIDESLSQVEVLKKVGTYTGNCFRILAIKEAQQSLSQNLPEALREFLPKNIVIETDPKGEIAKVTDLYGNQFKSLKVKIDVMKKLVKQHASIDKRIRTDLKSHDPETRMSALITAIMMGTGIRPGQEGNAANVRNVETGEKTEVETFGAITLGPEHVKIVRSDFAELGFVGKKGTFNVASLSDPAIIRVLKDYAEAARKGNSKYLFTTSDGQVYQYAALKAYFKKSFFEGLNPTDFRKLRSTTEVLARLYAREQALLAEINGFVADKVEDLKDRVTVAVLKTVRAAYGEAQTALNHKDMTTTVEDYVNPEVLLRFLSQGFVEDKLEAAILGGKTKLAFDPEIFIARAVGSRKTASGMNLGDLRGMIESHLADLA